MVAFGVNMIAKHATSTIERIYFCAFTPQERQALEITLIDLESNPL
jgi:hypothetical protein